MPIKTGPNLSQEMQGNRRPWTPAPTDHDLSRLLQLAHQQLGGTSGQGDREVSPDSNNGTSPIRGAIGARTKGSDEPLSPSTLLDQPGMFIPPVVGDE